MKPNSIYIAATGEHVGKTTTTLGLLSALQRQKINPGYCKPLGQKFVNVEGGRVDKDAVLFAQFLNYQLEPLIHSPIILGGGATARYLDNPTPEAFSNSLLKASKVLRNRYEMVVYEGTGHPGVGSVVDHSNAQVARMLNTGVILVVEAGVGNAIDRMNLSLSLFREQGVPIYGIIINKTLPDKLDYIHRYIRKKADQMGIDVLGVIPYDEELVHPLVGTVCTTIGGKTLYNEHKTENKVREVIAGSLVDLNELKSFKNLLLVVSSRRLDDAIRKIESLSQITGKKESPLSGIIITGYNEVSQYAKDYVMRHELPVLHSHLDTYEAVIKISRIEVKINTKTPWKIKRATELFNQYVDHGKILEILYQAPQPSTYPVAAD